MNAENKIHILLYSDFHNHIYVQDLSSKNLDCNGKNVVESICADNTQSIEKYEVNGDMLHISTLNGILQSTVFHPCTSIVLMDDLIVVQRCHNTEKIEVFGSNGWKTCEADSFHTFTTGSVLYITCPPPPSCVYNGIAYASPDQGPDLEMIFYLEDTEREPCQTRMRVLQVMIKCAHAFESAPDNIWEAGTIEKTKYKVLNSFSHVLRLCKTLIEQSPIRDQDKKHFIFLHRFFWAQTIRPLFLLLVNDVGFSHKIQQIVVRGGFSDSLESFVRSNNCLPSDAFQNNPSFR